MPDELPDECCGKCRFWSPPTENQLAENAESDGECLRYPPSLQRDSDGMLVSWFPDIADYEWCGEFQPDPPDAPQEVRRLDEPVQITAPNTPVHTTPPLWSPPTVYGPGFGPKEDNSKAWPEDWGK